MRKFAFLLLLAGTAAPAISAAQPDGERGERRERADRSERAERPARAERQVSRERSSEPQRSERASIARQLRERSDVQQVQVQPRVQPQVVVPTRTRDGNRNAGPVGRNIRDAANGGWQPRDRDIRTIPTTRTPDGTSGRRDRDGVTRHGGNYDRWGRDWRGDRRYDWRRHRDRNRTTFRLGFYYDPFGYSYRRYSIGSYLYPNYYQSNYWISDPWQYRLPPVYGPYRWVRYHNDALLIDTWSGQIVDVIYGFFW